MHQETSLHTPESGNQYSRRRPHPYLNARPPWPPHSDHRFSINSDSNPSYHSYPSSAHPPYPWHRRAHSEFPSISPLDSARRPQNLYSNISHGLSSDTSPTRIGAIQDVENVMIDYMDVNMNVGNINDQAGVCDALTCRP